jgi:hypothetical protein
MRLAIYKGEEKYQLLLANSVEFSMAVLTCIVNQRWREGKKEVMLRVFWKKMKYIEGILGIEILLCRMEGKNGKKGLK